MDDVSFVMDDSAQFLISLRLIFPRSEEKTRVGINGKKITRFQFLILKQGVMFIQLGIVSDNHKDSSVTKSRNTFDLFHLILCNSMSQTDFVSFCKFQYDGKKELSQKTPNGDSGSYSNPRSQENKLWILRYSTQQVLRSLSLNFRTPASTRDRQYHRRSGSMVRSARNRSKSQFRYVKKLLRYGS